MGAYESGKAIPRFITSAAATVGAYGYGKVIETEHIETETIKLNWSFGNYRVSERMKMATVNVIRNEDGYQTIYVISPPRLGWVCCNDSGTDFIQVKTMGEGEYETMANQSLGTPSHLDTRGVR